LHCCCLLHFEILLFLRCFQHSSEMAQTFLWCSWHHHWVLHRQMGNHTKIRIRIIIINLCEDFYADHALWNWISYLDLPKWTGPNQQKNCQNNLSSNMVCDASIIGYWSILPFKGFSFWPISPISSALSECWSSLSAVHC
jgi:hypothetical protein